MEWFYILVAQLRREAVTENIEEEIRIHLEMETQSNIERGIPARRVMQVDPTMVLRNK